jgi:SOS-response transcriptional repressor LexA
MGWSRNELARRAKLAQPSLRSIEKGITKEVKYSTISKIASATGKDLSFFTGNIAMEGDVPQSVGVVPLISWVQAGNKNAVADPYPPGAAEEWEEVTVPASKLAFALRVRGDSMFKSEGVSFPDGTIIVVEPEMDARNGDFVVVRFENTDEATFKQLIVDGRMKILKPLNPAYPTMQVTEDCRLCGVVIESNLRRTFR